MGEIEEPVFQVESQPRAATGGVLAGARVGQRRAAYYLYEAGFHEPMELALSLAVMGAESWLYTRAHNDNLKVLSTCKANQIVCNPETYEHYTVIDPKAGSLRNSSGDVEVHPPESSVVTTRDIGLMQINIPAEAIGTQTEEDLYQPENNVIAARALFEDRGWQPWVAFNTGVCFHDTYVQWALLGIANMLGELLTGEAKALGQTPKTRVPWVSVSNLRTLYPNVPLG